MQVCMCVCVHNGTVHCRWSHWERRSREKLRPLLESLLVDSHSHNGLPLLGLRLDPTASGYTTKYNDFCQCV